MTVRIQKAARFWGRLTGPFGGLDEGKRDPIRFHSRPVHTGLEVRNVDALGVGAFLEHDRAGMHCGQS